jgi:cell division protein FtsA
VAIFTLPSRASGIVGALDIGTTKVCCLIARIERGEAELLGLGHQRSRGLKSGMVVDAEAAEKAVRAAVGQAERMAGVSLDRTVLAVSCGRLRSASFAARAQLAGPVVAEADIARILAAGEAYLDRAGRTVIQMLRSAWRLDSASDIPDPRGLAGRELAIDLTAVTADDGPVRNLLGVVERGHMTADRLVAAPFASAVAASTEEERRLGALVIDMGGGLTSFAAFADGRLLHADSVPVGGNHVTFDLARALVTSVSEAEGIKTLYGTLVKAASNEAEVFSYPVTGDDEGALHQASKALVRRIVKPRIDGLIELLVERLEGAGLAELATRRIVLTGGASQLLGLDQIFGARFGSTVRIGRPQPIGRMPESVCSPGFSTVIGLVKIAADPATATASVQGFVAARSERGYLDRIERWIRESF